MARRGGCLAAALFRWLVCTAAGSTACECCKARQKLDGLQGEIGLARVDRGLSQLTATIARGLTADMSVAGKTPLPGAEFAAGAAGRRLSLPLSSGPAMASDRGRVLETLDASCGTVRYLDSMEMAVAVEGVSLGSGRRRVWEARWL